MYLKSFNSQCNVIEYHHYINHVDEKNVNVVELLLDCPIGDFVEGDLESILLSRKRTRLMCFHGIRLMNIMKRMGY